MQTKREEEAEAAAAAAVMVAEAKNKQVLYILHFHQLSLRRLLTSFLSLARTCSAFCASPAPVQKTHP